MTSGGGQGAGPRPATIVRVGIPILDVQADREAVVARAFCAAEQAWALGAPARTLAGRLAAKHALNGLAGRGDLELEAWGIETDPDGAPRVVRAPDGRPGDWRVSIAHSRTTAWALAARPGPEAGR